MRIAFWARAAGAIRSVLAAGLLCGCTYCYGQAARPADSVTLRNGDALRSSTRAGRTVLELLPANGQHPAGRLTLSRDQTIAPNSSVQMKKIAELGDSVLIVSDEYASRPGPMSYCQAGHEEFLRVLTTRPRLRETFHLKLQGCISNSELADPGVLWKPESSTLEIHWLTGPGPSEHDQMRLYRVSDNGEVKPMEPPAR